MKSSSRTIGRDRDSCSYSLQIMILAFLSGASATPRQTARRSALGFSFESVDQGTILPPATNGTFRVARAIGRESLQICGAKEIRNQNGGTRNTKPERQFGQTYQFGRHRSVFLIPCARFSLDHNMQ